MNKAIFCLSIDLELLWGRHDLNFQPLVESSLDERRIIAKLLELFKQYQIHVTWAIVGHLFLDQCKKVEGIPHPEITSFDNSAWLKNDPLSNIDKDPLWYGTDLIELIQKYPDQEIACHSFSHPDFTEKRMNKRWAESEIASCVALAKNLGLTLKSFVYPRNQIGFLELLPNFGLRCYRGVDPLEPHLPSPLKKIRQLIDLIMVIPHSCSIYKNDKLTNVPASMYFLSSRGWRKRLPKGVRFRLAKAGIDQAIERGEVFHLWFHPIDLVSENDHLITELTKILEYVKNKKEVGLLNSHTMAEIAET